MKYEISRRIFRYLIIILVIAQILVITEWLNFLLGLNIDTFSEILKFILNFLPPFIGVLIAFELNRIWENIKFQKRVRQIVPYIYFELYENLGLIYEWLNSKEKFVKKLNRFNVSHWEMFKEELAKWSAANVVPLTRIYYNLNRVNTLLKSYELPLTSQINKSVNIANSLIENQLERYEKWFMKHPKNKKQLDKVIDEYQLTSKVDVDLRRIIYARLTRTSKKRGL